MENALLITNGEKSIGILTEILSQASIPSITTLHSGKEARRLLIDRDFDLCVINAPISDEFGEGLAQSIAERGICEVILLVKSDFYQEISSRVEDYGIITVSKPLSRTLLWNALKLAQAAHKRMQRMQRENQKLLQKIEDIRIVDRAKCTLISYLSMTEEEAHKYIERQAMDMRMTRRAIAQEILKTYEN